jgi:aspartate carbamoyltransferase catalytic subunit
MSIYNETGNEITLPITRRPRTNLLDLDDFTKVEIDSLFALTHNMKEILNRSIKKVPSLRGKVILTLFYEASTRTRVSFEQAGKMLSADVINISASTSSTVKGESLLNTGLTIQAMGADLIIIRHHQSGAPYFMARNLRTTGVINAGDGMHAHPTQALLDLYTMRQHFGSIEGKKVVIVGDIIHSRVARSNIFGLATAGARVVLSGPPTLMPHLMLNNGDLTGKIAEQVTVETNLDSAIEGASVVMALRLQTERQQAGLLPGLREYTRRWQVNEERTNRANPNVLIMHPGPINEGVEISSDIAHGVQSRIEEQIANGVAVRMAILYELLAGPMNGENDQ